MNTKIRNLSIAAALAAALGLAGCAAGTGTTTGATPSHGMNHGSSSPMSSMMPDSSDDHNEADIMFAQMMIPHHAQAVEMSEIILAKQDIPAEVTALATRIKDAQAPEIETMTGWLKDWNQSTAMTDDTGMPGHSMSGMVDDAGMEDLDAAEGTEAVRLFLTHMVAHHEGAVNMAQVEIDSGKFPEAIELSRAIISAQEAEIAEMKQLLATL